MPERDPYTPSCVLNPSRKKKIRSRAEERGSGETGEGRAASSEGIDVELRTSLFEEANSHSLQPSAFRRLDPIMKLSFSGRAGIEGDFGLKGNERRRRKKHRRMRASRR